MYEIFSFTSDNLVSKQAINMSEFANDDSMLLYTSLSGASSSRECVHIKSACVECPVCGKKVVFTPRYGSLDDLPQFNTGDHFRYEELFVCSECGNQIDLMSDSIRIRFIFNDNSESVFRLTFTDYYIITPLNDYNVGCYLTFTEEFEDWVLAHCE